MLAQERFDRILALLDQKRTVTVPELCAVTGASVATIRRDLSVLDSQGRLSKVHGGAVAVTTEFESREHDVSTKAQLNTAEKERIARYAARQVQDGDVVFIDAGTTTLRMVEHLTSIKALFVTTGIECARRMVQKGLQVYVVGGHLKPGTEAIVGAGALETIRRYNFTKAFLGTNGVTVRQGCTTPDAEEAAVKTAAIGQSYLSYVLADSSKFGKVSAVTICPLEKACILTDRVPDDQYRQHGILKEVD